MADRDRRADGRPEQARPRDRTGRPLPYDTDETVLAEDFAYDTVEDALAGGVWLWDQERYFEAHEALEHVWHAAPESDRQFWQGVIQVAVGCVHHQRGNPTGAATLLEKAAARLRAYPDVYRGVDVEQLMVFAEGAAQVLRETNEIFEIGYPEFPAMDDGPWFMEAGPHPLPTGASWEVAAAERRTRSTEPATTQEEHPDG